MMNQQQVKLLYQIKQKLNKNNGRQPRYNHKN